jgi:phage tail tape-measure protein
MKFKQIAQCAGAAAFALTMSATYANDTTTTSSPKMTGKEKATAIGAGTGAVAGAVVGGPVGAVVGGVAGGYVGHEGTDAHGRVSSSSGTSARADDTVKSAQSALEAQGYSPGSIDGQMGPNTRSAVLKFQQDKGLTPSGTLDGATLGALGVSQ